MTRLLIALILVLSLGGLILWKINDRIQIVPTYSRFIQAKIQPCNLTSEEYKNGSTRFKDVKRRLLPHIEEHLSAKDLKIGSPVFLRSFKQEKELELWMLHQASNTFHLVHCWKITGISGDLGPKTEEGDYQSPEGFYTVTMDQFLPNSSNHLAFNVGYPNQFDRSHDRSGSFIMIHGHIGSVGCLAMTDPFIEEIYTICHAALDSGTQEAFQVHTFPFRMTEQNMEDHKNHQWFAFWQNLKEGYDHFEKHRTPPLVNVVDKRYNVRAN